jgi:hypothetical protein
MSGLVPDRLQDKGDLLTMSTGKAAKARGRDHDLLPNCHEYQGLAGFSPGNRMS